MAERLYLGLAFHNHQPIDSSEASFAESTTRAYKPLIDLLENHPHLRSSLHYSGPLLDWCKTNESALLSRIAALMQRGQVEMLTGGYYAPILAAIPDRDKRGQIEMLNQVLRTDFGTNPTGMWLVEHGWEPTLPIHLARSGVEWTILDEAFFKHAGLNVADMLGYYITEELGYPLKVFAANAHLRQKMLQQSVNEVMAYLRSFASEESTRIVILSDVGEKYGDWPGTFERYWQNGWMEAFAQALAANADWLHLILPGEYARHFPAVGQIYLSGLASSEVEPRIAYWRNALVTHPEINQTHKKMLLVHNKVYGHGKQQPFTPNSEAVDELWQAQAHDAYCPDRSFAHIRAGAYEHLIRAEQIADSEQHGTATWLAGQRFDHLRDGYPELVLEGSSMNLYFKPDKGGALFEWDYRAKQYNLTSSMTRRKEAAHQRLINLAQNDDARSKHIAPGLAQKLYYDWYPRYSMLDHCLHPDTTLDDFIRCEYGEQGDFVDQPFRSKIEQTRDGKTITITFIRDGHVWVDDHFLLLKLVRQVTLDAGSNDLRVHVMVLNQSETDMQIVYGNEWNLNLHDDNPDSDAHYLLPGREDELDDNRLDSSGELTKISEIGLINSWLDITAHLSLSKPATLWRFPIETVIDTEGSFQRIFQGSCILPFWKIILRPAESWSVDLRWKLL